MNTALIGYSGFVGSNIALQSQFTHFFNSKNIDDIRGEEFDLVVCAGVPAVKWWANQNPEEDLKVINTLADIFRSIQTQRFVLISTVDVYPNPFDVDENTLIDVKSVAPYGRHRLMLEHKLQDAFDRFHAIRLPGLFGKGLKKNVLYDLISHNILDKINPESEFQWYPLSRIWLDIQVVIENNLKITNFAVEPLRSSAIIEQFFQELDIGSEPFPLAKYDVQTVHAGHFGCSNEHYIMTSEQILAEMALWLKNPEIYNAR